MRTEARLYHFLKSVESRVMLNDVGPNTKRVEEEFRVRYLTRRELTPAQADRRAEIFAGDPERTAMVSALPVLQQIALLNMRESSVRRRIVNRLMIEHMIEETPKLADYAALVALGLASKQPYGRWHEPTREGRVAAATLERALCRLYQVHQLGSPTNGGAYILSYSCSCGWSTSAEKRMSNPDGSARRDHARHVERYRAGHTDEGDMAAAVAGIEKAFASKRA